MRELTLRAAGAGCRVSRRCRSFSFASVGLMKRSTCCVALLEAPNDTSKISCHCLEHAHVFWPGQHSVRFHGRPATERQSSARVRARAGAACPTARADGGEAAPAIRSGCPAQRAACARCSLACRASGWQWPVLFTGAAVPSFEMSPTGLVNWTRVSLSLCPIVVALDGAQPGSPAAQLSR
jgi:hypothetical protein